MTRSTRLLAVLVAALLTILLLPISAAAAVPDAQPDTASVAEDSGANAIDVLGNDATDAGSLVVTGATDGAHGTVTFDDAGVTYTPAANYSGPDTFDYTVTNDDGPSTAAVDVTVTPVNDPPVAHPETVQAIEDTPVTQIDVQLLANDTDIDDTHGSLTLQLVSQPQHGTLTATAGNHWTYTPDQDWNEDGDGVLDTFLYRVDDGNVLSNAATASIRVVAVNDPPSFTPGGDVDVDEDSGPASIPGWASGFDPGAPDEADQVIHFTISLGAGEASLFSTQPAVGGQGSANPGRLTFTPAADASGTAHVTVTPVDDGGSFEDGGTTYGDETGPSQTFTITISTGNDDPIADNETLTVAEDASATTVSVLAGDTDPDGDSLTIQSATQGSKGAVVIAGNDLSLTYKPNLNANGTDSFTYTVSDGQGGSDVGTVTVTITPVNDPPEATNDSATLDEDSDPTPILVLDNDDDLDGNTLSITSVTQGAKGSVAVTGGGTGLAYTPSADINGADSFTYTISDGHASSATATVSVTITPVNDPPVAVDDIATTDEDVAVAIPVRTNDSDIDGDTITITATTDGASGTVAITGGGTGLTYTPAANVHGADTFTYTVSDGHGESRTASVAVTITSRNDIPTADDDDFGVDEDSGAAPLLVLAGDADIDGDTITITAVTQGAKGAVLITGVGTGLTYRPFTNFSGPDTFTYTISDGHGATATATVTVTIGGENDPPNAVNDVGLHVAEGAAATTLDVLANDDDPDGNDLTISGRTNGAHGTVTITGNGTGLTYRPAARFVGTDRFTYTVDDGHGDTDSATVLVTVDKDIAGPVVVAPAQRLPGQTVDPSTTKAQITWSATDQGSGVVKYVLQVSTNGGMYATVALPKATTTTIARTLAAGKSYRFRVQATDGEGNKSAYVYGPLFRVARYQESSTAVTYTAPWSSWKNANALAGAFRYTLTAGRGAIFHPTAYDIGIVFSKTSSSGHAQVYVDGVLVTTLNLDRSSLAYRQLAFARHFPTLSAHTIEIRPVGDGRVDLDAFVLLR